MSWSGTVRCGYCRERGHNRRSCPSISTARKEERKTRHRTRTCNYCHSPGHNIRSCKQRKTDKLMDVKQNIEWRRKFIALCEDLGFGLGSLVTVSLPENVKGSSYSKTEAEDWHNNKTMPMGMVIGFAPKCLNAWQDCDSNAKLHQAAARGRGGFDFGRIRNPVQVMLPNGRVKWVALPGEFSELAGNLYETNINFFTLSGKSSQENIAEYFSDEWYDGTDCASLQDSTRKYRNNPS